ncbi:LysE family translocator [candidate division KSB1 bacterium]|nr:LysE family translocator [candidate division KSB1 bacterium]
MLSSFLTGFTLGFSAALAPGPLQALVISETMQHNSRAGLKVALAPLLTDAPIILFTVFILSQIADFNHILGGITIGGAIFLGYLGVQNLKISDLPNETTMLKPHSIRKAFFTNLLSPHPYLFWFSIGAPLVVSGYQEGIFHAVLFILGFYLALIGTFSIIAIFINLFQILKKGRIYFYLIRTLGIVLFFFAIRLFLLGLTYFKII